jgi:hypothetical protein
MFLIWLFRWGFGVQTCSRWHQPIMLLLSILIAAAVAQSHAQDIVQLLQADGRFTTLVRISTNNAFFLCKYTSIFNI